MFSIDSKVIQTFIIFKYLGILFNNLKYLLIEYLLPK